MKEETKQLTGVTVQAARTLLLFAGTGGGGGGWQEEAPGRNGKMRLVDFLWSPGKC